MDFICLILESFFLALGICYFWDICLDIIIPNIKAWFKIKFNGRKKK